MFPTHTMHVVVNRDNGEERSYPYAFEARQRLVMLCDSGITAYIYTEQIIKRKIN
jgi:hypothetical protein